MKCPTPCHKSWIISIQLFYPYHDEDDAVKRGLIEDDALNQGLIEEDVLKWNPLDIWTEDGDAERLYELVPLGTRVTIER